MKHDFEQNQWVTSMLVTDIGRRQVLVTSLITVIITANELKLMTNVADSLMTKLTWMTKFDFLDKQLAPEGYLPNIFISIREIFLRI